MGTKGCASDPSLTTHPVPGLQPTGHGHTGVPSGHQHQSDPSVKPMHSNQGPGLVQSLGCSDNVYMSPASRRPRVSGGHKCSGGQLQGGTIMLQECQGPVPLPQSPNPPPLPPAPVAPEDEPLAELPNTSLWLLHELSQQGWRQILGGDLGRLGHLLPALPLP